MTNPVQRILNMLRQSGNEPRQVGESWTARCPAHDDRNPSLTIGTGRNGGALLKCHAGCATEAVVAALGLRLVDLMPPRGPQRNGKPRIVATYDYRDAEGKLIFEVVRFEPKGFSQRRPDAKGCWTWSVKGVPKLPYRLPELLAEPARPVFVVEGEKDVDALARIGVLATTNAGGAGKWTAEHSAFLRDRKIIVLPDNDDAGRRHAQQVAQSLQRIAQSIRIVELPGLPEHGDASNWLAAGGTKEELERLAEAAPEWTPTAVAEPGPILTCMADVEPRPVSWLWPGRIPLGRITLLVGRPGEGKSFLTTDAAARVSTGTPWPDDTDCPQGSVLLISAEDDPHDTIRPRLDAHYADVRRVHLLSAVRRVDGKRAHDRMVTLADLDAIEAALAKLADCRLIVVDPIGSFLGGRTDAHRDNEVRGVLAPIAALAEKYGPAVLVVAHRRKSVGSIADDLALGSRAFTGIARAVWHLTRDPDPECKGRRLLLPGKNNLAREGDGLAFRIVGEPPHIAWERDPVKLSADDALAVENQAREKKPGPDAEAQDTAKAWLAKALADGPRTAEELLDEWVHGEGGSKKTLERAKQSLAVKSYRPEVPGTWWWRLPGKVAKYPNDEEPGDLGDLGGNTADFAIFEAEKCKDAKLSEPGDLGDEPPDLAEINERLDLDDLDDINRSLAEAADGEDTWRDV